MYYLNKTYWYKASIAFLTCLLLLILPACEKENLSTSTLKDDNSSNAYVKCFQT